MLTKKEEIYLSYIEFKNMYVVDLSTDKVIFDLMSFTVNNLNKKYTNIQ